MKHYLDKQKSSPSINNKKHLEPSRSVSPGRRVTKSIISPKAAAITRDSLPQNDLGTGIQIKKYEEDNPFYQMVQSDEYENMLSPDEDQQPE